MTEQCVGPEFDVTDAGLLSMRLAGDPAAATLPATGNGLRVDAGRGLWAPAEHRAAPIDASTHDSYGGVVVYPGHQAAGDVLYVTVTNLSGVRSMQCFIQLDAKMTHNIPKTVATTWALLGGFDISAGAGTTVPLVSQITRTDQGGTAGETGMTHTYSDSATFVMAPGGNARIRFQLGMSCAGTTGYVRVIESWSSIRGIGVTL